jgi:hypothetical protein
MVQDVSDVSYRIEDFEDTKETEGGSERLSESVLPIVILS